MKICIAHQSMSMNVIRAAEKLKYEVCIAETVKDIIESDVVVFTGGEDISPSIYGAPISYSNWINPERDSRELWVLDLADKYRKFKVGLCRGHQLIMACYGANLVQDIATELGTPHTYSHPLTIEVDGTRQISMKYTRAHGALVRTVLDLYSGNVNSLHHQGVRTIFSPGIVIASHKSIAELVIGDRSLSAQFHPEMFPNFPLFLEAIEKFLKDVLQYRN